MGNAHFKKIGVSFQGWKTIQAWGMNEKNIGVLIWELS